MDISCLSNREHTNQIHILRHITLTKITTRSSKPTLSNVQSTDFSKATTLHSIRMTDTKMPGLINTRYLKLSHNS